MNKINHFIEDTLIIFSRWFYNFKLSIDFLKKTKYNKLEFTYYLSKKRIYEEKKTIFLSISLACMLPIHIYGAKPIDTQAQLDRAREQQLARGNGLERDEL